MKKAKEVKGATPFEDMNDPPVYIALPKFSPGFIQIHGDKPLEEVLDHEGYLNLRPAFQSDFEIVVAEKKVAGKRRHFVSVIQLKNEELTSWL